jgi:hypothetical protein
MHWATINAVVGASLIAAFIAYDVFIAVSHSGNTWSEIARRFAKASTFLPWACGVLCGHFFHPDAGAGHHVGVLVWLTVVVVVAGMVSKRAGRPVPPWVPLLPGCLAGCLLWAV